MYLTRPLGAVGTCLIEVLGFYLVLVDVVSLKTVLIFHILPGLWKVRYGHRSITCSLGIHSSKFFAILFLLIDVLSYYGCSEVPIGKVYPRDFRRYFQKCFSPDDAD